MTEGLFLIDKDNAPKRMQPRAFATEDEFQSLGACPSSGGIFVTNLIPFEA